MAQGKIRSTTTGAGQARDLDARDAAAPPRARAGRPGPGRARAAVMAATTWLLLNEGYAATTLEAVGGAPAWPRKPFTVMPATARTWWPRSCAAGPTASRR